MISLRRLDNVQACIVDVRAGGLRRSDATHLAGRLVSRPAASRPTELPGGRRRSTLGTSAYPGVSLETVRCNFQRYGLLDDQMPFLAGWFRDTLPSAPISPYQRPPLGCRHVRVHHTSVGRAVSQGLDRRIRHCRRLRRTPELPSRGPRLPRRTQHPRRDSHHRLDRSVLAENGLTRD